MRRSFSGESCADCFCQNCRHMSPYPRLPVRATGYLQEPWAPRRPKAGIGILPHSKCQIAANLPQLNGLDIVISEERY